MQVPHDRLIRRVERGAFAQGSSRSQLVSVRSRERLAGALFVGSSRSSHESSARLRAQAATDGFEAIADCRHRARKLNDGMRAKKRGSVGLRNFASCGVSISTMLGAVARGTVVSGADGHGPTSAARVKVARAATGSMLFGRCVLATFFRWEALECGHCRRDADAIHFYSNLTNLLMYVSERSIP